MIDTWAFILICLVAVVFSLWVTDFLIILWDWLDERKRAGELDRRFMEQEKEWKEVFNEDC